MNNVSKIILMLLIVILDISASIEGKLNVADEPEVELLIIQGGLLLVLSNVLASIGSTVLSPLVRITGRYVLR